MTTPDLAGLCERLNSHMGKADLQEVLRDCREAAAAIERLVEESRLLMDAAENQAREADENKRLAERLAAENAAMPDLSSVIAWLDNGCDPKAAADELRIYQARIERARTALQGAADDR